MRVLKNDIKPEAYRLEDLAGGPVKQDQIQLCGSNREF